MSPGASSGPQLPFPRPGLWGFLLFALLGGLLFLPRSAKVSQPILYNHSKHIEMGMTCTDCHVGALNQVRATLPSLSTCLMCHEVALTESPEEEKIRTLAAEGKENVWTQLTRVPAHVYFSHRRHVSLGGLECIECHGPMETLTKPPTGPFQPVTMDACLACHQERNVDNDCNRCHR